MVDTDAPNANHCSFWRRITNWSPSIPS